MYTTPRHSLMLITIISIAIIFPVASALVTAQTPNATIGANIYDLPRGTEPSSYNFEHSLLRVQTTLWADGHGDVTIDDTIHNLSDIDCASQTWTFDWPPGTYWGISVRDNTGPLSYITTRDGTELSITVLFRQAVPIGSYYRFYISLSIAEMAHGSGDDYEFGVRVQSGVNVDEFVEVLYVPSNSTLRSVMPTPDLRLGNRLEWRLSSWYQELGIYVTYILSSTMHVSPLLQGQEPLDGSIPPWELDLYAWYDRQPNNINKWGCFLTSEAMIVNYYARNYGLTARTDPGQLNRWLKEHSGYDSGHLVYSAKVAEYSRDVIHAPLYYVADVDHRDDNTLDAYLRTGFPVVLGVYTPYGRHWVLATGKTSENGVDTYTINDPLSGETTLRAAYSNYYDHLVLFSNTDADHRHLRIVGHSPIGLLIVDPAGRRYGYDGGTDTYYYEIPGVQSYIQSIAPADGSSAEIEGNVVDIPSPVDGQYTVKVFGTGTGPYAVNSISTNIVGDTTTTVMSGSVSPGSVDVLSITYDSTNYPSLHLPLVMR